jgi:hypothetical protein
VLKDIIIFLSRVLCLGNKLAKLNFLENLDFVLFLFSFLVNGRLNCLRKFKIVETFCRVIEFLNRFRLQFILYT